MRIPAIGSRSGRLAKLALIPAIGLALAACSDQTNDNKTSDEAAPNLFGETANGIGFPHEVVTTEGIASASLYLPIFLIAVGIFIGIEGLLLFMAWRFRRKGEDSELPEQVHGSNKLEFVWTLIPAITVTVLFIASAMVLTEVESKVEDPAVVVEVEAYQFGWTFKYMEPDSYDAEADKYDETGIVIPFSPPLAASAKAPDGPKQEALLPVDVPVRFRLKALDVIHSFYVPAFFFKRDAIPGRTNEFEVTIEEPGVYGGQCAEFCGLSHGRMFFTIRAVEGSEYEAWVAEKTGTAPVTAEADATVEVEPEAEAEAAGAETTEPDPEVVDETSEEAA